MTDAFDRTWDAIVIGTGIGGAVAGRALAEAGQSVLFIEKGRAGFRHEESGLSEGVFDPVARAVRGLWPVPVSVTLNGRESRFFAPLGAGVGGSSVFYAATLERPERHDIEPVSGRPHPTGGWPVGYDAMRPWLDRASEMFALCGTPDPLSSEAAPPLRTPPAAPAVDQALADAFEAGGLHPYRLHSAVRHVDGCRHCFGTKCPKPCKMDARSAGIEPALEAGAELLTECEALRFLGQSDRIDGIEVAHQGETRVLTARRYILAAGALGSPRLLLASTQEAWPDGCANTSGLVGRNLMFHLNEMIALWPPKGADSTGPSRSVGLRDLYWQGGNRFGMVQALGVDLSYGEIVYYLGLMFDRSALRRIKLLRGLLRLPAVVAHGMLGTAKIFVGLMEDLPYRENRVRLGATPDDIVIEYRFQPELLKRRKAFRRAMKRAFRKQKSLFLGRAPELNFGHPSGTLVFGHDPSQSVLRPDCRAHDIGNLYVTDASFMPTSMGVNPSLTIAANALRVAATLIEKDTA